MPKAKEPKKTYRKLVEYVRKQIMNGKLVPGAKLPTERELADNLQISRNSVREGLRVLENIGIIQSQHGSGNYVSLDFNETLVEVLSYIYFVKGLDADEATEFRWMIEREALPLSLRHISEEDKKSLISNLNKLEKAETEKKRIQYDKLIHQTIVNACSNSFLIANYQALMGFMDRHIGSAREHIIRGMESRHMLEEAHRLLVEGVVENDLSKSMKGLEDHFGYIERYYEPN